MDRPLGGVMAWVRYDDHFPDHAKVVEAKFRDPGSLALHLLCDCWSATTSTPGIVTLAAAVAQVGSRSRATRWAQILVDVGLWHTAGHDCHRCPQPPDGAWRVHDWEVYNPTPADLSEKRSEAGKKGAAARWGPKQTDDTPDDRSHGNGMANNAPDPVPLIEPIGSIRRADVERICEHLAERIAGNGSKRPGVTDGWRTSARLLMDRDGRTEQQVHTAIDWCQDDEFWRSNVLSMPTLRRQYDQLRLQAGRGHRSSPNGRVRQGLALAQQMREREDAAAVTS